MKIPRWEMFCDSWRHEPETVEATVERTISIDGDRPHLVDLCADCDQIIEQIEQMVRERGVVVPSMRRVAAKKRKHRPAVFEQVGADNPADRTCPDPDCDLGDDGGPYVAPSRGALGFHTKKYHHKAFRDYPGFSQIGKRGKRIAESV